ncbi:Bug family tripartite tricarboxylate transporter substrate binding protein [Belnapia rosea]|uniref:Bug family tripartite tricarboxylate transporter substrate binding protein n=1 Tax=Belnapia rosea TaxID=938405 RepID=UPI000881A7D2|nr:tripartite tricarboxylate transporter substrate binding protein [Belnapia rosea]SDB74606.1 Tripartite-type tricarboxylate transporter, receptor component TctC [Belnapia rosea]
MIIRPTRRGMLGIAASATLATPALAAYPTQPIRVVVPWNPGGPADIVIRALAPAMAPALGQPVVIENRAGANGAVGTQAVARASPDGHTLILANAETHTINPLIYPRLPYDAVADFQPISLIVHAPCVLLVRPEFGMNNVEEFVAKVRGQPGRFTYATWGIGSTWHLAMEALSRQAKLQMLHVPFTGGAPASTALVSGQVDAAFLNAGPAEALARDGKLKILAVGGPQRLPLLPDVPTLTERSLPVNAATWFGLLGPEDAGGCSRAHSIRCCRRTEVPCGAGLVPGAGRHPRCARPGGDARLHRRGRHEPNRPRARPRHPTGVNAPAGRGSKPGHTCDKTRIPHEI